MQEQPGSSDKRTTVVPVAVIVHELSAVAYTGTIKGPLLLLNGNPYTGLSFITPVEWVVHGTVMMMSENRSEDLTCTRFRLNQVFFFMLIYLTTSESVTSTNFGASSSLQAELWYLV